MNRKVLARSLASRSTTNSEDDGIVAIQLHNRLHPAVCTCLQSRRIHYGVEVTVSSTNKQHTLSLRDVLSVGHNLERLASFRGDREGLACTCENLGNCMSSTGEYMKAISYFETMYTIAEELELEAYLGMGVAMRLHGRADRQAAGPGSASQALIPAAGASHLPGPRSYDADQQDKALAYLEHYLDWCVKKGRARCDGCLQERGEDAPMLTCSGCRVARCCSADHQKMASETRSSMADVCGAPGGERGEVGQPAVDLTAHGGNQDSESPHVAVSHP